MKEDVLKEDMSYNSFYHWKACLTGGYVLSETMSYELTRLTGRHLIRRHF